MAHVAVLSQKRQTVFFHWFDSYCNSLWPTTATSLLSNPHMAPIRKLFLAVCNLFQNLITGFASDRRSGFIWMEQVSTNTKQQLYGLTLFTQTPHHPNWPSVRERVGLCVYPWACVSVVLLFYCGNEIAVMSTTALWLRMFQNGERARQTQALCGYSDFEDKKPSQK